MRRAAKVDSNQVAIVAALRKAGAAVLSLAQLGGGVPDLLVWFRGSLHLLECKDGSKPPSHRQLTPDQVRWIDAWPGDVSIVLSPEDALRAVGAIYEPSV